MDRRLGHIRYDADRYLGRAKLAMEREVSTRNPEEKREHWETMRNAAANMASYANEALEHIDGPQKKRDDRPDLDDLEQRAEVAAGEHWPRDALSSTGVRLVIAADPATVRWLVQRARDAERHEEALRLAISQIGDLCSQPGCVCGRRRIAEALGMGSLSRCWEEDALAVLAGENRDP